MFKYYNANPKGKDVGDCAIRAISKANKKRWEEVLIDLCIYGVILADIPPSNNVIDKYLTENGFTRYSGRYTVERFALAHPTGSYVLITDGHAVACVDGVYFDTWDCGKNQVLYYFKKES